VQTIDLWIKRLGIYGEGIGEWEGWTVFVHGALPGEKVLAEIVERRKNFLRARLLTIHEKSPHRVAAPCPVFGKCGGCQIMHLNYPAQLIAKQQRVVDALERIGKVKVDVAPCEPSPDPFSYRNKIQLPVVVDSNLRVGLYAFNSHQIVEIDRCYIHCDQGEETFRAVKAELLQSPEVAANLRHILIKTAVATRQTLVIFVMKESIAGMDLLSQRLMKRLPHLKGVVQNDHPLSGNTILGKNYQTLAGQAYIEETICGLTFKISPASFFQVNPKVAEKLYLKVIELCSLSGHETVLDAYCGVGTLSLILASRAAQVIGVEQVSEAIVDARHNAEQNQILNAKFYCSLAEEFIQAVASIDVAVLNPPRKGCDTLLLNKLAELHPSKIVYVSCDPATLARDLAFLQGRGYRVNTAVCFDMFPQTVHVETVVSLSC
jgi:23S rRNA (uracil1939-C5)-methyltransferase